jgi:hypothetical protein
MSPATIGMMCGPPDGARGPGVFALFPPDTIPEQPASNDAMSQWILNGALVM